MRDRGMLHRRITCGIDVLKNKGLQSSITQVGQVVTMTMDTD